ncbi:MAG: hypothetical protein WD042_17940 [Phycisphaeraceae bacterium]
MFRKTAHLSVDLCVRARVHPDTISCASMVFAAAAALGFYYATDFPWLLLAAPLLCYVRLWLNMLDGMVAQAAGKASRRGEIFNDLPDRVSDILIFAGVAHSGLCNPFLAYWAALLAVMTAYVGTLGQAVAGHREFAGIMSKPWRMVVLHLGAWTAFMLLWQHGTSALGPLTVLDHTNILIIVGCLQTVFIRLRRTFYRLAGKQHHNHD